MTLPSLSASGPYVAVAATVAMAGLLVWQTAFPIYRGAEDQAAASSSPASVGDQAQAWLKTARKLLAVRRFRNGVLAQFMYVGGQVGVHFLGIVGARFGCPAWAPKEKS